MKEKHKRLLIAIVFSAIVATIVIGLIYLNTRQTEDTQAPQAFLMSGITEDVLSKPYVPWWLLGVIAIVCFVILTGIFYLLIGYLIKKKK